ncbi:MAG: LrgB family protein [Oscillospiraceae bacterium]|nr:LrgB family protein [Oscillospiraceae bacterium]
MAFFGSPLYGIALTIGAYVLGAALCARIGSPLLSPLLVGVAVAAAFISVTEAGLDGYMAGGEMVSSFLGPCTVALAVPVYRKRGLLLKNAPSMAFGIAMGSLCSLFLAYLIKVTTGCAEEVYLSLVPKSVTTPIGSALSERIGGIPSVTVLAIICTGVLGSVMAPMVLKAARIRDPIARGLAIGTSSHAIGTSRAVAMGEAEGSASGLAIGVAGIVTVLLAPPLVGLLG